jgi:hypothetical protein
MSSSEPWVGRRLPWWRLRSRRREQVKCQHPNLQEQIISMGAGKVYWCDDCGASWTL